MSLCQITRCGNCLTLVMGTKQFTTGYMTMRLSECPAVRLPYHRTWCWERWLLCISSHPSSLSWIELQLLLTLIGTVIVKEKTVEDTCGRYTSSGHQILHGALLDRSTGGKWTRTLVILLVRVLRAPFDARCHYFLWLSSQSQWRLCW